MSEPIGRQKSGIGCLVLGGGIMVAAMVVYNWLKSIFGPGQIAGNLSMLVPILGAVLVWRIYFRKGAPLSTHGSAAFGSRADVRGLESSDDDCKDTLASRPIPLEAVPPPLPCKLCFACSIIPKPISRYRSRRYRSEPLDTNFPDREIFGRRTAGSR